MSLPTNYQPPSQQPLNDGGDFPVAAQMFLDIHKHQMMFLVFSLFIKVILSGLAAFVDWSLLFEVFGQLFADEMGNISSEKQKWIGIGSCLTIAGFFVIGRYWYQGNRVTAIGLYISFLLLLILCLNGLYGSSIRLLFIGSYHVGWTDAGDSSNIESALVWIKPLYLTGLSVAFTSAGLCFIWLEHKIEAKFCEIVDLDKNLCEARARVEDYEKVRFKLEQENQAERERENAYNLYSNPNNTTVLIKAVMSEYVRGYIDTTLSRLNSLPYPSITMSQARQAEVLAERQTLENMLVQARSLQTEQS